MATLVPCLVVLRGGFNALAPGRDKETDGWIGDEAHAAGTSDHNPDSRGIVHAIDVDVTGPWPRGLTMRKMVDRLVGEHRAGRDNRLRYVIFDREIASASNGWTWEGYYGKNPHVAHAHFSASSVLARENDTRPFSLEDLTVSNPTPAQTWQHDVDPSAGTYSAAAPLWTILGRSSNLNTMPGQIRDLAEQLDAAVHNDDVQMDALAASLVLINAKLDQLLLADRPVE